MKTQSNKNQNRTGLLIAFIVIAAVVLVNEIWHRQFAILGYFVLVVLSPLLVLFISDLKDNKKSFPSSGRPII